MRMKRVMVLGLDGLEPTIVEPMLAAGLLPNLARLRDRGGYARVATTAPAQTPVAWSTVATGMNPGGHGIFDFLRRDPNTYLPDIALCRYERKNAFLPPRAVNLRRGVPVWDLLAKAGLESTVIRCPCTYPPDKMRGRMLSGMGTPDLRGGFGTATFYTSDVEAKVGESERMLRVQADADGRIATHLIGPREPHTGADLTLPITLELDTQNQSARLLYEGSPRALVLRQGEWSEWLRVTFKAGLFQTIRGIVRFRLVSAKPHFALYASPINFDPNAPAFPISAPAEYAAELAEAVGPYHTAGMVEDHAGLANGRFDEAAFLDQCATAWHEREAMMLHELARFDEGLFYCLFDTPDRVQHLFWRHRVPHHPANAGRPSAEFTHVIEEQYQHADSVVGRALEFADDQTLVLALSDHGFGSFERGVHLNHWLHEQGLLALDPGVRPGPDAGDMLRHVDWSRTRAYALGLAGIYLNMTGREARGMVAPDEADALKHAIAAQLTGLHDSARNTAAIRRVLPREALYSGPYATEAPDLVVHCAAGYRVSWATSTGGLGDALFEDNRKAWSGDHIIDPDLVPGVLFTSRQLAHNAPHLADVAPTILDALGVPCGSNTEGRKLVA